VVSHSPLSTLHSPLTHAVCILDRYLLRKFAQTFVICFLSLTGLYIVFDLCTNLDEFVRCGKATGNVVRFIVHYYSFQTILFFERTCSLLAMISAMFTVSWIQRHNEMTALLSAGVPRIRVLRPIIFAAAILSVVAAVNRETLIPRFRNELSRRPQDPLGDQPQAVEKRYDGQTDVLLAGKNTFADRKRISEPEFQMPPALRDYGRRLTADNTYYKPPEGDHPGGYLMVGVREPKNLDTRPTLFLNGQPVLITPHDRPDWLESDQCFLVSDVDFDQLTTGNNIRQLWSISQLIRGLRNPSLNFEADVRVAIHARLVQPLLDITLLFLGLPLIVTRENRNIFLAMGLCLAITLSFCLTVLGLNNLGEISYIQPALAAWAPLMIFVPLAVWLSESLWK